MNFLRALPCLLIPLALAATPPHPDGGGSLTIGAERYRFEPKDVASAYPMGGLPGAIRLRGSLLPEGPGRAFELELVVLKDGRLYLLNLHRKGKDGYPDTWAATEKTGVKVIALEDHPGGRVELACKGPLTGVVGRKPVTASWQGHLWAVFPEPAEED